MLAKYTMDVYPRTLFVAIGETDEAINEWLNGNEGENVPPMSDTSNAYELRVSDGEHGGALVRFLDKSKVTQGIVTHECFHAVMSFCDYLDINFDKGDNNEHVAYMLQWAVNKVFETLWKYETDNRNE